MKFNNQIHVNMTAESQLMPYLYLTPNLNVGEYAPRTRWLRLQRCVSKKEQKESGCWGDGVAPT